MTEQEQRVAISEECGWKRDGERWTSPTGKTWGSLPNYLNDLNAMHAAEKIEALSSNASTYDYWLNRMTNGYAWHAGAAQRAEAFLKTLGKWKD